jgi:peroxin-14
MMEKQTSSQQTSLSELQTELKSLKSLLVSRAPSAPRYGAAASSGNGPSSPGGAASPRPDGKPSIPSWQLAGSASTASLAAATPAGGSSAGSDEEKATAGGKGKSDEETVVV